MITDSHSIVKCLREFLPAIRQKYPVQTMALFGSFARDDASADSDIDILVEVDPRIGLRFVDLAEDLERILKHRVDLVSRRSLKAELLQLIEPDLIYV